MQSNYEVYDTVDTDLSDHIALFLSSLGTKLDIGGLSGLSLDNPQHALATIRATLDVVKKEQKTARAILSIKQLQQRLEPPFIISCSEENSVKSALDQ